MLIRSLKIWLIGVLVIITLPSIRASEIVLLNAEDNSIQVPIPDNCFLHEKIKNKQLDSISLSFINGTEPQYYVEVSPYLGRFSEKRFQKIAANELLDKTSNQNFEREQLDLYNHPKIKDKYKNIKVIENMPYRETSTDVSCFSYLGYFDKSVGRHKCQTNVKSCLLLGDQIVYVQSVYELEPELAQSIHDDYIENLKKLNNSSADSNMTDSSVNASLTTGASGNAMVSPEKISSLMKSENSDYLTLTQPASILNMGLCYEFTYSSDWTLHKTSSMMTYMTKDDDDSSCSFALLIVPGEYDFRKGMEYDLYMKDVGKIACKEMYSTFFDSMIDGNSRFSKSYNKDMVDIGVHHSFVYDQTEHYIDSNKEEYYLINRYYYVFYDRRYLHILFAVGKLDTAENRELVDREFEKIMPDFLDFIETIDIYTEE